MISSELHKKVFFFLLIIISLAFGWIISPFYGAVFWGAVLAILFAPMHRWLTIRLHRKPNLAALSTLLLCLVIVILPLTLVGASLIQEIAAIYQKMHSQQLNFSTYFQQVMDVLPGWLVKILDRFGVADLPSLGKKISDATMLASQTMAAQAVSIGQNTFDFLISVTIMLYLLFFFLRDGVALSMKIWQAVPLSMEHKRNLFGKFTTVIRATVKGNIAVAAVQGALGGVMFAFLGIHGALLWGVLMAILSLLPAVGAALIWGPVAIYFFVTGAIWQGVLLTAFGIVVIGLVDNILRPLLVGKDTQMPDYIVLISTLGGLSVFGLNGFVIGPVIAALFIAAWDIFILEKDKYRE